MINDKFKLINDMENSLTFKNNKVKIDITFYSEFPTKILNIKIKSLISGYTELFCGGFIPKKNKYKTDIDNFLIMHKLTWGK